MRNKCKITTKRAKAMREVCSKSLRVLVSFMLVCSFMLSALPAAFAEEVGEPLAAEQALAPEGASVAPLEMSLENVPEAVELTDGMISNVGTTYAYTGSAITVFPTVANGESVLVRDVDYTVSYTDGDDAPVAVVEDAGSYKVVVTAMGERYTGTASKAFTVTPIALTDDMLASIPTQDYTGNPIRPDLTITDAAGNELVSGEDYEVNFSDNLRVGTASIYIEGMGNYEGSIESTFEIRPEGTVLTIKTQEGVGEASIAKTYTQEQLDALATTHSVDERVGYLMKGKSGWSVFASSKDIALTTLLANAGVTTWKSGAALAFAASDGVYTKSYPSYDDLNAGLKFFPGTETGTTTATNAVDAPAVLTLDYGSSAIASGDTAGDTLAAITTTPGLRFFSGLTEANYTTGNNVGGNRFPSNPTEITVVTPSDLAEATIYNVDYSYGYTGSAVEPNPYVVDADGNELVNGDDYLVKYENNVYAGVATGTITSVNKPYYTGSQSFTFVIDDGASAFSVLTQTGKHAPELAKSYTIGQLNALATSHAVADRVGYLYNRGGWNVAASSNDIAIDTLLADAGVSTWKSGAFLFFADSAPYTKWMPTYDSLAADLKYFPVTEAAATDTTGAVDAPAVLSLEWTSQAIGADETAADVLATLEPWSGIRFFQGITEEDYTNGTNVGGNRFPTNPLQVSVVTPEDLSAVTISGLDRVYAMGGAYVQPSFDVFDSDGNALVLGTDYTVSYSNNTAIGTGTLTITAAEGQQFYKGSQSVDFKIGNEGVAFSVYTQTGKGTPALAKSYTMADLNEIATTHEVAERIGYLMNKAGAWGAFTSDSDIALTTLLADAGVTTWKSGAALAFFAGDGVYTKKYPSYDELAEALKYYPNTESGTTSLEGAVDAPAVLSLKSGKVNVGEGQTVADAVAAAATSEGLSFFQGITEANYTDPKLANAGGNRFPGGVVQVNVVTPENLSAATVEFDADYYPAIGVPAEPSPTVTDSNGNVLEKDKDYTITYANNEANGIATATITAAKGQPFFTGSKTATFRISDTPMNVVELGGSSRYGTAALEALYAYPEGAKGVIIAGGNAWPDALAATGLAGALNYPILLTDSSSLSSETRDAIEELIGVGQAIIVGGTGVVSSNVESQIAQLVGGQSNVVRLSGASRYETAEAIYQFGADKNVWNKSLAIIATGNNFPDALSASALAAAYGFPIFLTDANGNLSDSTLTNLFDFGPIRSMIAGGEACVNARTEILVDLATWGGFSDYDSKVVRCAGSSRYDTSLAIAKFAVEEFDLSWDAVAFASGASAPDALAGSVVQGKNGSVLLLANDATVQALSEVKDEISMVKFFGGTGAVPTSIRTSVISTLGWY